MPSLSLWHNPCQKAAEFHSKEGRTSWRPGCRKLLWAKDQLRWVRVSSDGSKISFRLLPCVCSASSFFLPSTMSYMYSSPSSEDLTSGDSLQGYSTPLHHDMESHQHRRGLFPSSSPLTVNLANQDSFSVNHGYSQGNMVSYNGLNDLLF